MKKLFRSFNQVQKLMNTSFPRIDKSFRYRKVWEACHTESFDVVMDIAPSNFKTLSLFGSPKKVLGIDLDLEALEGGVTKSKKNFDAVKIIGIHSNFFNVDLNPSAIANLAVSLNTTSHLERDSISDFISILDKFVMKGGSLIVDLPASFLTKEISIFLLSNYKNVSFIRNKGVVSILVNKVLIGDNGKPKSWGYNLWWRFLGTLLGTLDSVIINFTNKFDYMLVVANYKNDGNFASLEEWLSGIEKKGINVLT